MNYNGLTPEEVLAIATKKISGLKSIVSYKGVTTTALTDGSTTNPIIIEGSSYTATNGDCVLYDGVYYTWNGTLWQESLSFAEVITALENLNDRVDDILDGTSIDSFKDTEDALADKVDKVEGKGLSTNDYTDEAKAIVDGVTGALAEKADTDDIPDLVSDNLAKGIFGNETVLSTDNIPFISKTMGAGKYQRKKFVGCSFVWNQVVQNGDFSDNSNWQVFYVTLTANNNVGTITINSPANSNRIEQSVNLKANHVYYYNFIVTPSKETTIWFTTENSDYFVISTIPAQRYVRTGLKKTSIDSSKLRLYINRGTSLQAGDTVDLENIFITDLTQLFGSTAIADYIYNLEQATAGAGIAKLKELGFFTEDYYSYDAGSVQSVDIKEYAVTGFNLWDEDWETGDVSAETGNNAGPYNRIRSKNYISVIPSNIYYIKSPYNLYVHAYDKNKTWLGIIGNGIKNTTITISSQCYYLRFRTLTDYGTTYNNDICINLSDPARNGQYEPYHKTTYSLTPTELRGVPRIDANNNIYCDGDEYASDGGHTEKYDIVDMGELNWSLVTNLQGGTFFFADDNIVKNLMKSNGNTICPKYLNTHHNHAALANEDKTMSTNPEYYNRGIYVKDTTYESEETPAAAFKAAMSGVPLIYEKATPTTETLTPFDYPQSVGSIEEITDYKVEQEDRDVAIPTGHVTDYMGKGGEFTLPTLPETPSVLAFDGYNAYWNKNVIDEIETAWNGINHIMLPGRDLTVVFANEIANYSDEWAWIQAKLNAHDVSGLRVGDYISIKIAANGNIAAETHKAEIAGINTYIRTGDTGHKVGYHIDWITCDCYSGTVQINTGNTNNGNASNSSPFLASNLKSWLDGTLYPLLETKLKNVIKTKRILAPYRYQSGTTLTDDNTWGWEDFDKLWVPLETEIFDCPVWSTKGFGNGQAVQYPIFANSYAHRIKSVGPGGVLRSSWCTASAYSGVSTVVVIVTGEGYSSSINASYAIRVPVCFRTMEA